MELAKAGRDEGHVWTNSPVVEARKAVLDVQTILTKGELTMGSESDSKAPLFWLDALSAINYVYVLPCSKYCLMCRYSWKPFNEELVPPRMIIGRILRYFPNFLHFQQTHGKSKDRCCQQVYWVLPQKGCFDYILVRAPRAAADENRSHRRTPPNAYQVIMRWSDALIDQRADGQHHQMASCGGSLIDKIGSVTWPTSSNVAAQRH